MSRRLPITMSIPSGKMVKIRSSVMKFVSVGREMSHSCKTVVGSWLGYFCCKWAIRRVSAANASGLGSVQAKVPMR